MADDMHAQKMSGRFDTFDRDGKGYVVQRDVEQMARAVLEEFSVSPSWGKGRALLRGAGTYWRGMSELPDGDRLVRLTREEFIAAGKRVLLEDPKASSRSSVRGPLPRSPWPTPTTTA